MFLKNKQVLKPQIIVNPESNKGRTGKKWNTIKDALKSFFKEYNCEFTEKPFHATEISREAIKQGAELIVGIGGDGTVNEIANGFFEDKKIINPGTVLGVVPSGTGCDLSRSLKIPSGLKKALELITQTPSTVIDIGRAKFRGHDGQEQERLFLNVGDFGIGGEVVRKVNQSRMKRKASSYLKCLVSTFLSYKNKNLRITIDNHEFPAEEYMIGAIANGRIFGKGMKIAPKAELNDGYFDIILIKGMKILEFCANAWKLYTGNHLSHPKISMIRGKKIDVIPAEDIDVLIELDGEQLGNLPASFEIIPHIFPIKGAL